MTRRLVVGCLLLSAGVLGCATTRTRPPEARKFQLGNLSGEYRPYGEAKVDPCQVDGRWLRQELDAFSGVMAEFLNSTSAGQEGVWSDDQLALLSEAPNVLPAVLDAVDATVTRVPSCRFDESIGFPETLRRTSEFNAQARRRLADAPETLAFAKAKRDVARWHSEEEMVREEARKSGCPRGKTKTVFYASEDENGARLWSFCDGTIVTQASGESPRFDTSARAAPKRPQPYLDAVTQFPLDAFQRAPKLPMRATQETPEPDTFDLDQPIDP